MNTTFDLFSKWAKTSDNSIPRADTKLAVIYTRVSSKEQFDKNLSLDWQKKTVHDFAERNQFTIAGCFGGTYESAKTDGRKEFQRMLEFIKKNKGKVTHILVYLLDRFSRSGGGAIKLAQELREKYGVTIIAVTQPIDTSNPGGVFQQNMQFLFSEYDNQLRRQRAMAGMKEKFSRGIWALKPPIGYDIVRLNGERKIIVNETGKKLRKAFQWKLRGMKNEEILERLRTMGVKLYKQKLSQIFSNPFYCGIISTRMLNGRLVEGQHEKLITPEIFLKVNNVRASVGGKFGVAHTKENENIPLKVFMKCNKCDTGYTGYIVKAKKLYYYKCRTKGCKCNKSAKLVNHQFSGFLMNYSIQPHLVGPLLYQMGHTFTQLNQSALEQEKTLNANLNELQKKIDALEEKYFLLNEMPRDTYDKLVGRLTKEKQEILNSLSSSSITSSNLQEYFKTALTLSTKLATVWASSDVTTKEKLQKLIFPAGVVYDCKNEAFRTEKVNSVFALIASLNSVSGQNETGQTELKFDLSSQVG